MATEKEKSSRVDAGLSEQAMAKVLMAEEKANQAIRECEEQGVRIIQEAKNKAQKISKHADDRIAHIHLRFKQCVALQVKILEREYEGQQKQIDAEHYDDSELSKIVDRVADMLTGSSKSGKD